MHLPPLPGPPRARPSAEDRRGVDDLCCGCQPANSAKRVPFHEQDATKMFDRNDPAHTCACTLAQDTSTRARAAARRPDAGRRRRVTLGKGFLGIPPGSWVNYMRGTKRERMEATGPFLTVVVPSP